eukprot:725987-Rhodomonas_salina.2
MIVPVSETGPAPSLSLRPQPSPPSLSGSTLTGRNLTSALSGSLETPQPHSLLTLDSTSACVTVHSLDPRRPRSLHPPLSG